MENLTLESLPKAFTKLIFEVSELKRLILELSIERPTETNCWLNLNELCDYLPDKPSKATVYSWVQKGLIPFHKGIGQRRLKFSKPEIDSWINSGRVKTKFELDLEAEEHLNKRISKKQNSP